MEEDKEESLILPPAPTFHHQDEEEKLSSTLRNATITTTVDDDDQDQDQHDDDDKTPQVPQTPSTKQTASPQIHNPDHCSYSSTKSSQRNELQAPKKANAKLQPSPSSASSYSNTSSLFRDDGFEDDFVSTASDRTSTYQSSSSSCTTRASSSTSNQTHRLSFQGRHHLLRRSYHQYHSPSSSSASSPRCSITGTTGISGSSSSSNNNNNNDSNNDNNNINKPSLAHPRCKNNEPGYLVDSNLSISQRVVTEIIETERTYVDDLEQIVTGYICFLRNVLKQQKQSQQLFGSKALSPSQAMLMKSNNKSPIKNMNKSSQLRNDSGIIVNDIGALDYDSKSMLVFDYDLTGATNDCDLENDDDDDDEEDDDDDDDDDDEDIDITQNHRLANNSHHRLFSNLEDIYKFNKDLLFRLEECYLDPSSVAECFVENSAGFDVYTHYCTTYPLVVSTLTELMANPTSAQLLKERQEKLGQSLPLGAYLLKPVQRILKYHILFQSLITHTANENEITEKDKQLISEAFSVMSNIAGHINSMKKRHEHAIRVQEVQGLLNGWRGPDLTTLGELILEESFKIFDRPKSSRHLFLFDNVLLITKKKRDGSLAYKGHIECSNLMLIENIKGQPLVFETVPFDNPKALCAFQARNLDKKRDWCLQMKEVIIKSFDNKIPHHVRDLLMSLTKSTIDTDLTNTETSSESISRALKAPNYLVDKNKNKIKHQHNNDKKKN